MFPRASLRFSPPTLRRPCGTSPGLRTLAITSLTTLLVLSLTCVGVAGGQAGTEVLPSESRPAYDEEGRLRLPEGFREWVFVGASIGLTYSEGSQPGMEMFHETLMEPAAYRHFVETGEFADGTQLVLLLHRTEEGVLPGRRGRFAGELGGVEMAVKDSGHLEQTWGYYGFGGASGLRPTASAFPSRSCHDCHAEHAAADNVFLQFYPLLSQAAGVEVELRPVAEASTVEETSSQNSAAEESESTVVVAFGGLDPVMLVEGREEAGKEEIVEVHEGWQYRFASEPNRAAFAADPERYAPQNDSCPVIAGAATSPDIFAVYEGRIYTFATPNCRDTFESDPSSYVQTGDSSDPAG